MNSEPLFIVQDAFQIRDRGCVLVPGASTEPSSSSVRVGNEVLLIKPDGTRIISKIRGFEMINFKQIQRVITAPILLSSEVRKEDVPPGTKIFLMERSEHQPAQNIQADSTLDRNIS